MRGRKPGNLGALLLALLASATLGAPRLVASPHESAELLVQQGRDLEAAGDPLTALRRYRDALTMDVTCESAYLALGELRLKRGELNEADEVFSQALLRMTSAEALFGRGRTRHAAGRLGPAALDLRAGLGLLRAGGSTTEQAVLQELVAVCRQAQAPAEELPAWRRLLVVGRANHDPALGRDASLQVRTLTRYLDVVDPVRAGREGDAARRTLAAIALRGG